MLVVKEQSLAPDQLRKILLRRTCTAGFSPFLHLHFPSHILPQLQDSISLTNTVNKTTLLCFLYRFPCLALLLLSLIEAPSTTRKTDNSVRVRDQTVTPKKPKSKKEAAKPKPESPPPSSLRLPRFSILRPSNLSFKAKAAGIDAGATDNLRRLRRLR
ncbi:hypothetical protein TIFTF001_000500 [Ficus carica]|uniref:Uncharacterized protein n=1 Tax=Ficus carica TaxID=3494 RepID=A0AA87ZAN9_FICCA|nr:hypothetical protein TIFTF001_000500 [Ficus carica]